MSYQPPPYPPSGPPPNYGYPQPGYGREHPQGTTVLVLGILSLVVCGLIGPFAWSMGNRALAEIDAYPGAYNNRGQIAAGRTCGIVATILVIAAIVFFVLVFGIFASAWDSGDSVN